MIEVEAKIRISNPSDFRKKAKEIGRFVNREKKVDDYYTLENLKEYPRKSLRVRRVAGSYEINFKQKLSYIRGVHVKNEQEFVVKDAGPFVELIRDFGFKRWLRKEKISENYAINKNFHIEINYVKNLGWFLEIEYLCDKREINMARKRVLEIVEKMGIKKRDIIGDGYTKMLWVNGKLGI